MADLTHDHLDALANRLELSYRRECDQIRTDLKEDFLDLKSIVRVQNGRIGKTETSVADLQQDARVLLHDFKNHLNVPELSSTSVQTPPRTRGFTAGVTTTVIVITGAIHAAWDWIANHLPDLVQALRKP